MVIGSRTAGLESAPGKLLAVEVSRGAVTRATVIELPPESPAAEPLERALVQAVSSATSRAGVRSGPCHLVAWDAEHTYRTMLLPPMPAAERGAFLGRELARERAGAQAFGSRILRRVDDGGPKDAVLVVAVPHDALELRLAPFVAARSIPRLVTTASLALIRAARTLAPEADQPTLIGHWGPSGLTLVIVSDGELELAREIPGHTPPGLDPLEWLGIEIQRSAQHYAMSHGRGVSRVLFGHAQTAMAHVFADPGALEARLRLPVIDLNEALGRRLPDGTADEAGLPAGAFLLPFGAALLTPGESVNLLPPPLLVERRSRQLVRAALAAGLLVALTLGGCYGAVSREAAALRRSLEQERQTRQALEIRAAEADRVDAERQQARRRIRLVLDDPQRQPPWADVLKEISRLAPDELRLERLVATKNERGFGLRLHGAMPQADAVQTQTAFSRFYFGLMASPLFYDVTFTPAPKPDATAAAPAPPGAAAPAWSPPSFEIALGLKRAPR